MTDKLTALLAEGKDYYWALRQGHEGGAEALREAGIDDETLDALRALQEGILRSPAATAKAADHLYFKVTLPGDVTAYFAPLVTEHSVETGTELFPERVVWTFAHTELQYCTGGDTPMTARLVHGAEESKHCRAGDVMLIPENTLLTYDSSEVHGYGHAHIFTMNLSTRPRTFYDALPRMRLAYRGLSGGSHTEVLGLAELGSRIEVLDWSQLVSPRATGGRELPTWLRNGWDAREWTRALDYAEGTKSLVVAAPDREPDDYLEWGHGSSLCQVNPVISEAEAAVTDCVFPSGWTASPVWTELWTVLRGTAVVRQTLAPLHAAATEAQIASGVTLVVPGGARVTVEDASDDLVVRRLAGSCAHNGHWAMMEAKLVADGIAGRSRG